MTGPGGEILVGNCRERLRELAAESAHCVVTSPPYWGLRDYGTEPVAWGDGWVGSLGLEPTPEMYVTHILEVFREVRRVLRPDGTLWLNLGDSYAHGGNGARDEERWPKQHRNNGGDRIQHAKKGAELKPKDLAMLPAEVALMLRGDGWWLRSDIIWAKPNPMPESVTDRPTIAHEHVFLLTPGERYFYDAEAVREPGEPYRVKQPDGWDTGPGGHGSFHRNGRDAGRTSDEVRSGRNLRSVWTIATQPYPEAHFATFPEELARRCIAAGTSERGCCPVCGAPWRRVMKRTAMVVREGPGRAGLRGAAPNAASRTAITGTMLAPATAITTGWQPTCAHGAEAVPCTVLDPFAGSGTTLAVADMLGRRSIGIELKPEYIRLIVERVRRRREKANARRST